MSKLQDCQFFEIKVKGKTVTGGAEDPNYNKWIEGFVNSNVSYIKSEDNVYIHPVDLSLVLPGDSSDLIQSSLTKGQKNITITIAYRASDKNSESYEPMRYVFDDCDIDHTSFEQIDGMVLMRMSFVTRGSFEMTFNQSDETGLKKIGPFKYDLCKNKMA